EAFVLLRKLPGTDYVKLRASGWLGENQRTYFEQQRKRLEDAGLLAAFEHVECPRHADKVAFLQSLDVLSVPAVYREPKGIYVLEALANGVPVVQPQHGSFPELVEETEGGVLVKPDSSADLAQALHALVQDRQRVRQLGERGQAAVHARFHAAKMAEDTVAV